MKQTITYERLRQLVSYSPLVGVFEWRRPGRRIRQGGLAGGVIPSGYVRVCLDGRPYPAHRLAWLYMTREWPEKDIDHIDGDRSNNAFSNLRLATQAQNCANTRRNKANTSGVKGVSWQPALGKWRAMIRSGEKSVFDKSFDSLDEAKAEIEKARNQLHGQFANHGMHKYEIEELDAG